MSRYRIYNFDSILELRQLKLQEAIILLDVRILTSQKETNWNVEYHPTHSHFCQKLTRFFLFY